MSVRRLVQKIPVRTPFHVGLLAVVVAFGFSAARLVIAGHGDVSKFVVAGQTLSDSSQAPAHLHVFAGGGYDGQFYWRLAIDPTNLHVQRAEGVLLDGPMRASRIAYPALAWVLSLGAASRVSVALVLVNVLAFGALAWAGAVFARRSSRSIWYGLFVASATGLLMSLARDLIEVVMVAAIVGGIVALRERKWLLGGLAWSLAVLSHEQCLFVIGAFAVWHGYEFCRRRARPGLPDVAWALPVAAFVAWQFIARAQVGVLPLRSSGSAHIAFPFQGLAKALDHWLRGDIDKQALLVFPQLAVVVALIVVAWRSRAEVAAGDRWIQFVLAAGVLQAVCLSYNVWEGPAELRQIVLVPTLACAAITASRRRVPSWLFIAVGVVWLATAGLHVVAI